MIRIVNTPEDYRWKFMLDMAESFQKMVTKTTQYKHRIMCLTSETSNALSMSINGLVSLAGLLLQHGLEYVMFRHFQSDRLEGEFGVFRQLNGGNYHMSVDHVCNALKLQRIKLFSRIDVLDTVWHTESNCCSTPLSEEELESLNDGFQSTNNVTEIDRSTVYYVAGYISHKENLDKDMDSSTVPTVPASEFTTELSRGKLSHPPSYLYDLGLYLLTYYKTLNDKNCLKKIMLAFNQIYVSTHFDIPNACSVLRRFANTFSKAFVKKESDKIVEDKKGKIN